MLKTKEKISRELGKSSKQKWIIDALNAGKEVEFRFIYPCKSHYGNYVKSWNNLIDRIEETGHNLRIISGKLGGTWTERIVLK